MIRAPLSGAVASLMVAVLVAALNVSSKVTVNTTVLQGVQADLAEVKHDVKEVKASLNGHLTDPTIHHTKLIELETRIQALERNH